ncbi:uncharacterized protein LOC106080483 [Stomoxys calcitrans]|uniref:uncharacterized protein LOC106080483 n=1 Tax=Stomoxys calcitrans TaxID=35570 RepID=UPI0027E3A562|nr:uncharacterized protein LOC106080483 [Stomoxys calcitrans]XP_013097310.2 uncharacterized protein LOC106080483 [Stomoxys calcitrans]
MNHLAAAFLIYLHIMDFGSASKPEPYCIHNITEYTYVNVTKTRQVVVQKPWYNKLGKTKTKLEEYTDTEARPHITPLRVCCEGYKMSELHLCEPQCVEGCPKNSKCVEPEVCKCLPGYFSSFSKEEGVKHYCEAICEKPCGENCQCIRPNECECASREKSSEEFSTPEIESETEISIDSGTEESDQLLSSEEPLESSTWNSVGSDSSDMSDNECPDDFVLYRGQCQPLKFAIDEIDCRVEPCADPQAICHDNGTCTCREGFRMLKKASQQTQLDGGEVTSRQIVKSLCLTSEDYQLLMAIPPEDSITMQEVDVTEATDGVAIFFIVLGVLTMTGALIFLGLRLARANSGRMEVEGKQLECAYDSRGCRISDAEKSVI